ncbi:hypothetical protein Plec18167_001721 [Paecilomyces lecythidis]|uniref:Cytochrome P450 n=1 Tax=Paecilomyces lecythidis TaxID=3004212 RepID=A0ABR3YC72_9EURO
MSYVPFSSFRESGRRFGRIIEYGRQSMHRLRKDFESGTLSTPFFFSKIMNIKDTENGLTAIEMEEEASEFMITGTDTTSNTLTYLVWAVINHPAARSKLEWEINHMLPEKYTDSDIVKLEYLSCVVRETLRLYGAASGSHPRCVPRGGWKTGNYYLPEGTVVLTQAYSLHRCPGIFPDPLRSVINEVVTVRAKD